MSTSLHRLNAGLPLLALLATSGVSAIFAQTSAAANPDANFAAGRAIAGLRPALAQVSSALSNLKIARWKAPGDLRDSTGEDVDSIQRDITVTLPPLIDQAQGAGPEVLAPAFATFRNIDALYDVLLRVTEMATLTGSSSEAERLEDARAGLETARAQLGNSLLQSMSAQDAQLVHLRTQASSTKTAVAPIIPTTIVVDDGPQPAKKHPKKKPPPPQPPPQ